MTEQADGVGAGLVALARRAPGLTAMLLMAVAGVGISIYLTTIHYAKVAPFCTTGGVINCASVLRSQFSNVPGTQLPITIPGLLWFVVSGGLAFVGLRALWRGSPEPERLRAAHFVWAAAGMLFVLYLVYAEIVVLHSICEWCTTVHIMTFATFLIALGRLQHVDTPTRTPVARGERNRSANAAHAPTRPATGTARHGATTSRQRTSAQAPRRRR
ncbi:MAG: hypothetical protein OJF49_001133 [Ktedonobacterales bacterium]|jgi:uncharacterized membrane protein|nr:MAG: hypothetical protein OJF49_001133 [Ktedonobacterales bacterium]